MASSACGVLVACAVIKACASVFVPPQASTHKGRGSARSAARMMSAAPALILPGPTAAMPYAGLPFDDDRAQRVGGRKAVCVQGELGLHLLVAVEHGADDVGPHLVLHPRRSGRDQPFDVVVGRVDEKADQRHLIVRLVGDVGHHDDPLLLRIGIDADIERRRCLLLAARHVGTDRRHRGRAVRLVL